MHLQWGLIFRINPHFRRLRFYYIFRAPIAKSSTEIFYHPVIKIITFLVIMASFTIHGSIRDKRQWFWQTILRENFLSTQFLLFPSFYPLPLVDQLEAHKKFYHKISKFSAISNESQPLGFSELNICLGTSVLGSGVQVDRSSAGYLTLNPGDDEDEDEYGYTMDKIRRKYGRLAGAGQLHYIRINKVIIFFGLFV